MNIDDLIPTQNTLRDYAAIDDMRHFVCMGGIFSLEALQQHHEWTQITRPARLIAVAKFEDGTTFIRDGHHRVLSIWLANRNHLTPDEYSIEQWRYEDFMELSESAFNRGFVTPFDPRTHVRLADLRHYKDSLPSLWLEAENEIRCAWKKHKYVIRRSRVEGGYQHIHTLANGIKRGCQHNQEV